MRILPERDEGKGRELRLEDIHAEYKRPVLRQVNLTAEPGRILALVGPNGAGKSSLLRVVAGLLKPTLGRVWFGGEDFTPLGAHQRVRRGVSYAMQGGKVFSSLTVAENLELGMPSLSAEERRARFDEVCGVFPALRGVQGARAGLLSGGVRQVLALATKLVRRPRLLLLDEPTVGLSPRLARDVFEHLARVNRERGTTILIVERDSAEVLSLAHRAALVCDGTITRHTDRPVEWLTDESIARFFFKRRGDATGPRSGVVAGGGRRGGD